MKMPLQRMRIRTAESDAKFTNSSDQLHLQKTSPIGGAYGNVRDHFHQGWDLYAPVGSPAFAIADAVVMFSENRGPSGYGLQICLRVTAPELLKRYQTGLYAFYGHLLSSAVHRGESVHEGEVIGQTGLSGNASSVINGRRVNTPPHLHFEIRTIPDPGPTGRHGRIDPGEILGYQYYSSSL
jgi:murein DD-endopeptidase MepM/ murein hydrolase activator NlpD